MRRAATILLLASSLGWVAPAGARATGTVAKPGTVATVAGKPLTTRTFDHWLRVAAIGANAGGDHPLIVPVSPPRFPSCIARERREIAAARNWTVSRLRERCRRLFRVLGHQTLDFLIRGKWLLAYAAQRGIVVADHDVRLALERDRRAQFRTLTAFHHFLSVTGQTLGDVVWRVRVNLTLARLLTHPSDSAQTALDRAVTAAERPHTTCARAYAMSDCGALMG